ASPRADAAGTSAWSTRCAARTAAGRRRPSRPTAWRPTATDRSAPTVPAPPALPLLAEVQSAADAKRVAGRARAVGVYARRQQLGDEIVRYATTIKVDALTLMGKFLNEAPKNRGTNGQLKGRSASGGVKMEPPERKTPTLAEQGIKDRKVAANAQKLA